MAEQQYRHRVTLSNGELFVVTTDSPTPPDVADVEAYLANEAKPPTAREFPVAPPAIQGAQNTKPALQRIVEGVQNPDNWPTMAATATDLASTFIPALRGIKPAAQVLRSLVASGVGGGVGELAREVAKGEDINLPKMATTAGVEGALGAGGEMVGNSLKNMGARMYTSGANITPRITQNFPTAAQEGLTGGRFGLPVLTSRGAERVYQRNAGIPTEMIQAVQDANPATRVSIVDVLKKGLPEEYATASTHPLPQTERGQIGAMSRQILAENSNRVPVMRTVPGTVVPPVTISPSRMLPAVGQTANPGFVAGPAGVAVNAPYVAGIPTAAGELTARVDPAIPATMGPTPGMGTPGSPMGSSFDPAELAETLRVARLQGQQGWNGVVSVGRPQDSVTIPPVSGDTVGGFNPQSQANLEYPLNVVPNAVRPRQAQTVELSLAPSHAVNGPPPPRATAADVLPPADTAVPPPPPPVQSYQLPSAPPRPLRSQVPPYSPPPLVPSHQVPTGATRLAPEQWTLPELQVKKQGFQEVAAKTLKAENAGNMPPVGNRVFSATAKGAQGVLEDHVPGLAEANRKVQGQLGLSMALNPSLRGTEELIRLGVSPDVASAVTTNAISQSNQTMRHPLAGIIALTAGGAGSYMTSNPLPVLAGAAAYGLTTPLGKRTTGGGLHLLGRTLPGAINTARFGLAVEGLTPEQEAIEMLLKERSSR